MHTNRNTHPAMLNERKNFQMNYIEQLVELGIGTALITIIVFMLAVSQIWNIFNNFAMHSVLKQNGLVKEKQRVLCCSNMRKNLIQL